MLRTYVGFIDRENLWFFYSPVLIGYIRKAIVHLVQKCFLRYFSTGGLSFSERVKKLSDENNIKKRQRQDRDETVLLLAERLQLKLTLRRFCQSIGPVVKPLPPPTLSLIPRKRFLSYADVSVVVVEVFFLIFLRRHLCCC